MARQGRKGRKARQGRQDARTQGKACHHHRQGIGKASARHRQLPSARHHRHAIGIGRTQDGKTQQSGAV
jgi:hypothetical protein